MIKTHTDGCHFRRSNHSLVRANYYIWDGQDILVNKMHTHIDYSLYYLTSEDETRVYSLYLVIFKTHVARHNITKERQNDAKKKKGPYINTQYFGRE